MPVTQLGIVNSALGKIGVEPIQSLTSTSNRIARLVNNQYSYLRDATLRDHHWKCATTRAVLAPNSTTPAFRYNYTFDLPSDWLRTVGVYDNSYESDSDSFEWTEEGSTILANASPIYFKYVFRNTDESSWDALFAEGFAWRIASEVAYAATQSLALQTSSFKAYMAYLAEARSISSMGGTIDPLVADTWLNARN